VGIGLNVNRDEFPPELAARATSLRIARNASCHRGSILASVLRALEEELDAFVLGGAKPLAARVGERLGGRGQRITLDGEPAQLVGVAPSGALRVERDGQVTEHVAGTLVIDEA
ncbi:MAG: hypothetical protein KC417_07570, partial [Myxococcales bacterium]|nr:hypothetical protein [Myxococcales bacterium]